MNLMVIFSEFRNSSVAVATSQPYKTTTTTARVGTVNMSLSLPPDAFIPSPTKTPAASSHHGPQILTTPVSALHLTRLLSLFLQASLFASGLVQCASVQAFQVTRSIVYHSIRLSTQAVWSLWDSTHGRRLRKKIEFEFFTLILGGGNNLCLIIFWPGWAFFVATTIVLSIWYAT